MSYISAVRDKNDIIILERDDSGQRRVIKDKLDFVFYVEDEYGDYETIFGEKCVRYAFNKASEFYNAKSQFPKEKVYEDDVNPIFRYLSKNYDFNKTPPLHIVFYDIEVGYTPENKYSTPDRADNPVISVSVQQDWCDTMHMLVLPPPTMTPEQAEHECDEVLKEYDDAPYDVKMWVFDDEGDLLKCFLHLIEDADVITGWNSKMYDFKYLTNRIPKIIGPYYLKDLCLLGKDPAERTQYNKKFKREETYYDCLGRVHLDYMELYKTYTYTELSSYALNHVSYVELDEEKIDYPYSLDHLYKYDFRNFVRYNIKDTYLIKMLDDRKKFIDLTNLLAHSNGVLMETTLGTVSITEQAILNQGHYFSDKVYIFPSKTEADESESGAAGAFVSPPQKGMRKLVAGNDINSLYPSTIRALNMSPETLVAQIDTTQTDQYIIDQVNNGEKDSPREAWGDLFNTFEFDKVYEQSEEEVILHFNRTEDSITAPAYKIYDLIYNSDKYIVSANGSVFTREKDGIIPTLLARWYAERKEMQAEAEKWEKKVSELSDGEEKRQAEINFKFWDQRQLAKKIMLNALYGALLNKHFRFYDKRLGQSTTLTGRSITRHMSSKINELIEGDYNYLGKSIIYGDSVTHDTIISTNNGEYTIEKLFVNSSRFWEDSETGKEYSYDPSIKVKTYDPQNGTSYYGEINYIYRHKTSKSKWLIRDSNNNEVIVTEDHSIMIENDDGMIKISPKDIVKGEDVLITVKCGEVLKCSIEDIVWLGYFDNEYVYDVGMKNAEHNWFFGNNILLKNTDSSYFSMYEAFMNSNDEEKIKYARALENDRDLSIELYDNISENTNKTFPEFMNQRFNTGINNGSIIKAGRENISSYSLFIKKKRYAMNLFDKDGIRQDTNGKSGKLKIMGIEIKRSDTPKIIQNVLEKALNMLLDGEDESKVLNYLIEFKKDLLEKQPWLIGKPSGANAVDYYTQIHNEIKAGVRGKTMIPNAIAGAIAWNELLDFFEEDHMEKIKNGSKVIVCPLKINDYGYDKIAYPTDQIHFPEWFKELPFDIEAMAETIFYKKVNNIFGVLDWDMGILKASSKFHEIFVEDDD
ncbi:DNA polymerase [Salicola phage SCTP-2]|nr:DNA polymerase [Salicola phage SCTP-2]